MDPISLSTPKDKEHMESISEMDSVFESGINAGWVVGFEDAIDDLITRMGETSLGLDREAMDEIKRVADQMRMELR